MPNLRIKPDPLPPSDRLQIVVLGYIVRGPLGGMAWHHLQYVLGLHQLGHDVLFLEDSDDYPSCYDPRRNVTDCDATYGLKFTQDVFNRVGLERQWTYYDAHTRTWYGPAASWVTDYVRSADLLLNVSGVNPLRDGLSEVPLRILLDTDPAFTQIRHLQLASARERAAQHTHTFSFGENIGNADCSVPQDGFRWLPTRQPVVFDAWQPAPPIADGCFTTVMQWDSYPAKEHQGVLYGMKRESFADYFSLPQASPVGLEVALGGADAPREMLFAQNWRFADPLEVTRTPWRYQQYLRSSRGEFSVAKHGYVISRSGWFSERTACYLACGKPVVVQDTAFSQHLPVGAGLHSFTCPEEALAGLEAILADYPKQCREARAIAETYFDSRGVLGDLIQRALAPPHQ